MEELIKELKKELQKLEKELETKALETKAFLEEEDIQDDQFDAIIKNFFKTEAAFNHSMEEYELSLIEEVLPPAYISEDLFKKLMKTTFSALH